ncbi:MAG: carbohydrate-binding domain-containing protein [Coprobacter sp.]|nr:carbohydrate-binding domain-containing protein [Coprobacter sp.]
MTIRTLFLSALLLPAFLVSCTPEDLMPTGNPAYRDDSDVPGFVAGIRPYEGELADDAASDVVGSSVDYYWERNGNNGSDFAVKVNVEYHGTDAPSVACENPNVTYRHDGAHVVLDMTRCSSAAEITVSGQSADGSLKIYGGQKIKLTLAGVDLTSLQGPAINNQDKKACFVHLAEGTTNRLTDAVEYASDVIDNPDEDSKGCFFSEGNVSFSGTGVLVVRGRQRHGIAADGFCYVRPGVTIAVTEAAKNAIRAKGDSKLGGMYVTGGLIYAHVSAAAGKCLKSDMLITISGGKLDLNTSGEAWFDTAEEDTSSPSCIKSDGNIIIRGGLVSAKSTGAGGKGINAAGNITISGGTVTVSTTGNRYVYNELTSSPKGIKAEGNITINDGTINVAVLGKTGGAEGIDSKSTLTINGGDVYVYACDDAVTALSLNVKGGRTYAYSVRNDGIVSDSVLSVSGGLVIASGSTSVADKKSFYSRSGDGFKITGGTLLGVGGPVTVPSAESLQPSVVCDGLKMSKGETAAVLDASGALLAAYAMPRSMQGMSLFFSAPALVPGATYALYKGGQVSNSAGNWYGWYDGGSWSGGSSVGRVACSDAVSVDGN